MEEDPTLGQAIADVLSEWPTTLSERPYQKADPAWLALTQLEERLRELELVQQADTLVVRSSPGAGKWAQVPWVALLDSRETTSTQGGVFIVFLFRMDGSGVYVCLAQGVGDIKGTQSKSATLRSRAEQVTTALDLKGVNLVTDPTPDLRASAPLPKLYEQSVIAYTFYEADAIPSEESITQTLGLLVSLYAKYLDLSTSKDESPTPSTSLSQELFLPTEWLETIESLLREKRQVIFKGPPGTGKTFVAKAIAKGLTGDISRVRIVQFHPSYSYEDFVQGFRPAEVNGAPGFELVDGPLLRLASMAKDDPDNPYILIIDEINRGNVAKVFGELFFLLEYRDEAVQLQYGLNSNESPGFELPSNLWIIGTMNTADQSIALLDSALRRRFYFVDFYPTEEPIGDLLENWLKAKDLWSDYAWLVAVIDKANNEIGNREISLGPSYFLCTDPPLSEERIATIWEHSVLPFLEEQFFGDEDRRARFQLEALRQATDLPE